jgi:small Trp-rich protein
MNKGSLYDNNLTIGVFLVFLALKLAGIGTVAQWSWWWVMAPVWFPLACYIIVQVFEKRKND